jgi:hypothetical protein
MSAGKRIRTLVFVLTITLIAAASLSATPVLAATVTSTAITTSSLTIYPSTTFTVAAAVTPIPDGGTVHFELRDEADAEIWHADATVSLATGQAGLAASLPASGYTTGDYQLHASYSGTDGFSASEDPSPLPVTLTKYSTTLSLTASRPGGLPLMPFTAFDLKAQLGLGMGRTVEFWDITADPEILLGTAVTSISGLATLTYAGSTEGTHTYAARWNEDALYFPVEATTDAMLSRVALHVDVSAGGQWEQHHPVDIGAGVWSIPSVGPDATGDIEVRRVDTDALIGTVPAPGGPLDWAPPAVGIYEIYAHYPGDSRYLAGDSLPASFEVVPDVVHVRGLAISDTYFYPQVDKYQDTTTLSGIRDERASVAVRIFNSSGSRVRNAAVPSGTGKYTWTWKGKNDAGKIVKAGKYRIVQTFTDSAGTHLAVTKYVTVSLKRLYWHAATLTKAATNADAKGTSGAGKITGYTDGHVVLRGVSNGHAGWAGIAYQFTLPSADAYKSLKVGVRGMSTFIPPGSYGAWNFGRCQYSTSKTWPFSCFDYLETVGFANAWQMHAVAAKYRSGRHVRTVVSTYYGVSLLQVRVSVMYGILK